MFRSYTFCKNLGGFNFWDLEKTYNRKGDGILDHLNMSQKTKRMYILISSSEIENISFLSWEKKQLDFPLLNFPTLLQRFFLVGHP